jgi:hypothetical protein
MPQNTSININSSYFIDRLENDIVQLTKTFSIEHSISIEEAKLMTRRTIQSRLNQLLTKEEKDGIKETTEKVKDFLKGNGILTSNIGNLCSNFYELFPVGI